MSGYPVTRFRDWGGREGNEGRKEGKERKEIFVDEVGAVVSGNAPHVSVTGRERKEIKEGRNKWRNKEGKNERKKDRGKEWKNIFVDEVGAVLSGYAPTRFRDWGGKKEIMRDRKKWRKKERRKERKKVFVDQVGTVVSGNATTRFRDWEERENKIEKEFDQTHKFDDFLDPTHFFQICTDSVSIEINDVRNNVISNFELHDQLSRFYSFQCKSLWSLQNLAILQKNKSFFGQL